MSAVTPTTGWQWSADVLAFAAQNHVEAYLDPLLEATQRLFPTALNLRVFLEDDPEIRDDWHIVLHLHIPQADVSDYRAATSAWNAQLFRICPAPLVCIFRLILISVAS